jgi:DNA uptake protein ComE-like DNA-binding protein
MIKKFLALIFITIAVTACGNTAATTAPATDNTIVETSEATVEIASTAETVVEEPTTAPAEATATPLPATPTVLTEEPTEAAAEVVETATPEPTIQPEEVLVNTKLNLNEATGDDYLAAIPGFGNRMVREFLEYRPYISIQQFRREIGKYVDEAQVAEYEQYVYVPVNVDESDAETLQQIPGLDETIAAELMAARPYGSNEAFLTKLAEYVSAAQLAGAESYLVAN